MFYTKDLYLDAVSEEGAKELFQLYNDYELMAGIENTGEMVIPRQYDKLKEEVSGGGLCFLVRLKNTFPNKVIGYVSLSMNWITHVGRPLLFIGKDYRGNGYGKQLMALIMYVAFQEVNCRKIAITVYSFNERAIHVYQAVGFNEEGRQLEDCYRTGQYWDVVYLGLFKKDYREYWRTMVTTTANCPHNPQQEGDKVE